MNNAQHCTLSLLLACCSGSAIAGDLRPNVEPISMEPSQHEATHLGYIYYNIGTGERISTIMKPTDQSDPVGPADADLGREIWVVDGPALCEGQTMDYFIELDTTFSCSCSSNTTTLYSYLDWGDMEANTVVDCVRVNWVTNHPDTDTNSDGVGDGVLGFGARWTFWDGMGPEDAQIGQTALPIITLQLHSLPGSIDPLEHIYGNYTMDIDLAGSSGPSMVFEIGDTDSDLQGAQHHNARMDLNDADGDGISDLDPDQDGLADWGWSINFIQPGTVDFDNADGDNDPLTGVDGQPFTTHPAGVRLGAPLPGHAVFHEDSGTWEWVIDTANNATTEDMIVLVNPDWTSWQAYRFFDGFDCDPAWPTVEYIPYASIQMTLYGPGDGAYCGADLNRDGEFDFLDIQLFVSLLPDYTDDGSFDFLDISMFLNDFNTQCGS